MFRGESRICIAHVIWAAIIMVTASCGQKIDSTSGQEQTSPSSSVSNRSNPSTKTLPSIDRYSELRQRMVDEQLAARDIVDPRVLDAMRKVPRHQFVPKALERAAYDDSPLPIGAGQTISQPYIVALMTQLVDPQPDKKALDIGTGSGYQAAVLAELVESVHSIEIVDKLASDARSRLTRMGYKNITVRSGDGYRGWASEAPFDIIIVAAAPDHVPEPLVEQLAPGGKMVIPVGDYRQLLLIIEKAEDGSVREKRVAPVAFVPMTGEAQNRRD